MFGEMNVLANYSQVYSRLIRNNPKKIHLNQSSLLLYLLFAENVTVFFHCLVQRWSLRGRHSLDPSHFLVYVSSLPS